MGESVYVVIAGVYCKPLYRLVMTISFEAWRCCPRLAASVFQREELPLVDLCVQCTLFLRCQFDQLPNADGPALHSTHNFRF